MAEKIQDKKKFRSKDVLIDNLFKDPKLKGRSQSYMKKNKFLGK